MYEIQEVDAKKYADEIKRFNGLFPKEFLPLKPRHLDSGFWWLVHQEMKVIAFAGMVPFLPFPRVGYLKRAAVADGYRGQGIQAKLMELRLVRARASTDWTHVVSECHVENTASANNFIKSGFMLVQAERPWAKETMFWSKAL